jgi:Trk K+ transport system NAD-binding subunit
MEARMTQPVILCGLGRVGSRVLDYLRAAGVPVVVVDNHCAPGDPRLGDARLVQGDCRRREVLEEAGVAEARGVLILTSDDLINISTALMVRHLHANVRVVLRLFNQVLIPRLGKAVANVFALSTSALTAPVLALTALSGDTLGAFALEDGRRQVADLTVGEQSAIRGRTIAEVAARYRVLILAHLPAAGGSHILLDVDQAARLGPDDHLIVCGEPRDLMPLLDQVADEVLPHLRWAGWLRRNGRALWRTLSEIDLAVKICTGVLVGVILLSTLVYFFGIHEGKRSVADALYRTVSVMATGADMHERELTVGWQKVFVSFLRIAGAALVASFTAIVTNFLLRARLGGALEIRRIPDGGHVVVCGLGNVGFRVVEELRRAGEPVVVIERARDGKFMATARRLGIAIIVGDAAVMEVLRQAKAATARAVVAATDSELVNLEVALLARELNPRQRVVLRLSDTHLAETLRDAANIRLALSIPALAAPAFVAALFGDRVQSLFLVAGRQLAVVELVVQPEDPFLSEQTVRTLSIDYGFLPVSLARADRSFTQQSVNSCLYVGDRLTVIAQLSDLDRLLRRERVPADWAVEVTGFNLPARPLVAELLRKQRGLSAEAADEVVGHLPVCVGSRLTRGQAEELSQTLAREGIKAEPRQVDGQR